MRLTRKAILALMMAFSTSCGLAAAPPPSVQATKDDLVFRLSLEKTHFIEGEPVIATVTLINKSDSSRILAEPCTMCRVAALGVKQISGAAAPSLPGGHSDYGGAPPNYGWEFKPGEAHSDQYDLQIDYTRPLPVGKYEARASYNGAPAESHPDAWHGSISVEGLQFSVVAPEPKDAKAAKAFGTARSQYQKSGTELKSADSFASLTDPAKGGPFAKYAGYFEAMAYWNAQQGEAGAIALRKYIAANEKTPYYGKRAVEVLADWLRYKGYYVEARQLYSKMPDGFDKAFWVKRCDELDAAQPKDK